MTTMRAQRLDTATREVSVRDVPIPDPGPGEVLIKVAYCGICHSDLSLIDGTFGSRLPEVTQGHEASGVVAALGEGVTDWQVGDRVIPAAGRPDFTCVECKRANFSGCLNLKLMAFDYDGGWAEYTTALALSLTRVPDTVSMRQAALLADAVATPYGAVVNTAQLRVGESVGVWGLGGVGTHIVQIARLVGAAPIIALDLVPEVRERALELGADLAVDPTAPDAADRIREATGGRGLDTAFDAVGVPATFEQARWSVRVGGRLVVVGMSNQSIELGDTMTLGLARVAILGHLGYKNEDIATLADLVARGRLDLSRSVSDVVALDDVADGIRRLEQHEGNPIRILVRPGDDVD
ncbi:D-arabinose 1-dehydrogenase, Zn-dependent alcohol dehydrogenase family [Jatrophihabitans endophyticus]|uniref:D-arabinose 1-dehydrogenase, Zn-dependent alcohol dehydrogenase family n=1 Tax=Jatrophihabitans endophyticus TaxID=1206085 RepID=A0A1M5PE02_9ACTN|nr:zinc-binding dehydrogenase [Jatrophihabitans endophyticus]SHH00010.1 D-arabinose 1-dehydrogenase, Zn-dependent alcohol dehydrogenase family [Jatrophihabitans endophyticus]